MLFSWKETISAAYSSQSLEQSRLDLVNTTHSIGKTLARPISPSRRTRRGAHLVLHAVTGYSSTTSREIRPAEFVAAPNPLLRQLAKLHELLPSTLR